MRGYSTGRACEATPRQCVPYRFPRGYGKSTTWKRRTPPLLVIVSWCNARVVVLRRKLNFNRCVRGRALRHTLVWCVRGLCTRECYLQRKFAMHGGCAAAVQRHVNQAQPWAFAFAFWVLFGCFKKKLLLMGRITAQYSWAICPTSALFRTSDPRACNCRTWGFPLNDFAKVFRFDTSRLIKFLYLYLS